MQYEITNIDVFLQEVTGVQGSGCHPLLPCIAAHLLAEADSGSPGKVMSKDEANEGGRLFLLVRSCLIVSSAAFGSRALATYNSKTPWLKYKHTHSHYVFTCSF